MSRVSVHMHENASKNIESFPVIIPPDSRGGRGDPLPQVPQAPGGGGKQPQARTQIICVLAWEYLMLNTNRHPMAATGNVLVRSTVDEMVLLRKGRQTFSIPVPEIW